MLIWFVWFVLLGNVAIKPANDVGGWGGSCTCPNGETYEVGDNKDSCGSLACVGGTSGTCNKQNNGPWSNRKVICSGRSSRSGDDEIYGSLDLWDNSGKN